MNQIERRHRQRIGIDVVPADMQIRIREAIEKPRVDVGSGDLSLTSDFTAKPCRDAPTTRANVETCPTGLDSGRAQVLDAVPVEQLGERSEARDRRLMGIVEGVSELHGMRPRSLPLFAADACVPNDGRPLCELLANVGGEFLRAASNPLAPLAGEIVLRVRGLQNLRNLTVQFGDDCFRRAGRSSNAQPPGILESGKAGFRDGWNVGY